MSDKDYSTMVVLDDNAREVVLNNLNKMGFAVSTMHDFVKTGTLPVGTKEDILSLLESHMSDISKKVEYDGESKAKLEQRHTEIRSKNLEIRGLNDKLANAAPLDLIPEKLRLLCDTLYNWWNHNGFGHSSEMKFTRNGWLEVEFCFSLHKFGLDYSDTPNSDRKTYEELVQHFIDQGFMLINGEGRDSYEVVNCDSNRDKIIQLLKTAIPSIDIDKWEIWERNRLDAPIIWHMKAYIKDLKDIDALIAKDIDDKIGV
jgi:hypothetical protein